MSIFHKFARAYAGAGRPVFPLNGKAPATRHGFKDATTDLRVIDQWWTENPNYNIGLPVLDGEVVLDVDPRSGGLEGLAQLAELPATNTCITGRGDGGKHLWFKVGPGVFTDRNLPDGIDIRVGGRHYLVGPPSIHPDSGGHYYWSGPEYMEHAPRWLLDIIRPAIKRPEPPQPTGTNTGDGLIRFVSDLQEGQRNHGYFWAVCEALKDGIWATIQHDLKQAALSIGLTEHEVEASAASAQRRMTQ